GNYSIAKTVEYEAGLVTERVEWPVEGGSMKGYLARPEANGKYPSVIIIHENRGLNPHIEDVTRRAAQAGFLAMAPDALSLLGGTPDNEDEARALFSKLNSDTNTINFASSVKYLKDRADSNGNVGCVGFCWGGAMANQLAVHAPDLKAGVAFYGRQAQGEDVAKVHAPLQLHYAEMDERVNAGIADYEKALKEHNKYYELYMYPGVGHAFHNDTSTARYNEDAAKLAWQRTLDFFNKYLRT
ncbi:MAG: dienelactone hydrolase family protein, partial [Saprospiraceae bacterium]